MSFKFDKLYRLGAWGAAACMLAICALVSLQVVFRSLDAILAALGIGRLGLKVTGLSEIAAYLLVGAAFLGLAYTFVHHAHIRVTLLISRLSSAVRAWVEVLCLLVALAISIALTYGLIELVRESLAFKDVSSGFMSIPLWIPQTVLAIGVALLGLALLEALLATLRIAVTAPSRYRELSADDDEAQP